jgi:hypothetical protein
MDAKHSWHAGYTIIGNTDHQFHRAIAPSLPEPMKGARDTRASGPRLGVMLDVSHHSENVFSLGPEAEIVVVDSVTLTSPDCSSSARKRNAREAAEAI